MRVRFFRALLLAMALPATDVFTGANGTALTTYSANWSLNAGNFSIQTNALAANGAAAATETAARWNADVFPNDQYAQGVLAALSATVNANIGIGVRIATDNSANYYGLYYDDDTGDTLMFKVVAGVWTQLGAAFTAVRAVNDILRLEVSGTTLTYKLNGVSQGTRVDASLASGSAGVVGRGLTTAHRIDTWEGGSLSAAATAPPRDRAHSPQHQAMVAQ